MADSVFTNLAVELKYDYQNTIWKEDGETTAGETFVLIRFLVSVPFPSQLYTSISSEKKKPKQHRPS